MGKLWPLVCLMAACGSPAAPTQDAGAPAPQVAPGFGRGWVVTSTDDHGAPRFLWSTSTYVPATGLDAARAHLERTRDAYEVAPAALATLRSVREVGLQGAR